MGCNRSTERPLGQSLSYTTVRLSSQTSLDETISFIVLLTPSNLDGSKVARSVELVKTTSSYTYKLRLRIE